MYLTESLKSSGFNLSSWLPTDPDELSRASIDARVAASSDSAVGQIVKPALPLTLGPNGAKEAIWRAEPLSTSTVSEAKKTYIYIYIHWGMSVASLPLTTSSRSTTSYTM